MSLELDARIAGLRCRADPMCRYVSRVTHGDDAKALARAAQERNRHERDVHAYVHQQLRSAAQPFSSEWRKKKLV